MGWCSATTIFDAAVKAVLPFIPEGPDLDAYIWKIADVLWKEDWDCESDSDYFYLLLPLMHKAGIVDDEEYQWQLENVREAKPPA